MHKVAEKLVERYLSKVILEITLEVCNKNFDEVFREACKSPNPKDTTIGTCYRNLERMANEEVQSRLNEMIKEVSGEMGIVECSPHGNPFAKIACNLWETFLDYYDTKGYVENIIGEEWEEKQAKLQQDGILDAEGDYTRA